MDEADILADRKAIISKETIIMKIWFDLNWYIYIYVFLRMGELELVGILIICFCF